MIMYTYIHHYIYAYIYIPILVDYFHHVSDLSFNLGSIPSEAQPAQPAPPQLQLQRIDQRRDDQRLDDEPGTQEVFSVSIGGNKWGI